MTSRRPPRVALVSVGLGRVRRGFERYFSDLFGVLQGAMDITLLGSEGRATGRRVPVGLRTATLALRALPLGRWAGRAEYNRDCLAFGLTLLPELMLHRFDVVHCIDPPLGFTLQRLARMARLEARILFTEGCVMPPELYPQVDHIHHVGQAAYDAAVRAGVPSSWMTLVPCGVHVERFAVPSDRASVRSRLGVRPSTLMVLAVSAVKKEHKRVDHLIEEVARLEGDVLLWIDGNPEDPSVVTLARDRLGERCRITHLPSSEIPDLYQAADVFVHASCSESFGLSIVEALCSGCPVLVHDAPHFAWLVEDPRCLVDMQAPGQLAARLRRSPRGRPDPGAVPGPASARIRDRFGWPALTPGYLDMYARVAASPARSRIGANAGADARGV